MLSSTSARLLPRVLLLAGGTALGILLLALALQGVNPRLLGADLAGANRGYLALVALPFAATQALKVLRWTVLIGEDAPTWQTLLGAVNVGFAVNTLLPIRVGELVSAYWVRERASVGMVRVLSTLALDRVCDGAALVLMLLAVLPTVALPGRLLGPALGIGAISLALLMAMGVAAHRASALTGLLPRAERGPWRRLAEALEEVSVGFASLRRGRSALLLVLYTVAIWVANVWLTWLVVRAFHLHLPLSATLLLTALLSLGVVVPSPPGYVGVLDYAMVIALGLYGVGRTPALAAAIGYHLAGFLPATVLGLLFLAREGLRGTWRLVRPQVSPPA